MDHVFGIMSQKFLPNPRSQRLSSRSFIIVLIFTFMSTIHCELIFCRWCKVCIEVHFFIYNLLKTILFNWKVWKDCPFQLFSTLNYLWAFIENQLSIYIYMGLFRDSVLFCCLTLCQYVRLMCWDQCSPTLLFIKVYLI